MISIKVPTVSKDICSIGINKKLDPDYRLRTHPDKEERQQNEQE